MFGAEVADPEGGVVGGDDAVGGVFADEGCAADFVGAGGDLGDGVAVEVGDEDLAAVGLHGEVDGGLADVEEVEQVVGLCGMGPDRQRQESGVRRRGRWTMT